MHDIVKLMKMMKKIIEIKKANQNSILEIIKRSENHKKK